MKKLLTILTFISLSLCIKSQNLVINGDFEEFRNDSIKYSLYFNDLKGSWICLLKGGWYATTGGNNLWYCQESDTNCQNRGKGSIYYPLLWMPEIVQKKPSKNGLFQTELTQYLLRDTIYSIELYLKFSQTEKNTEEVVLPVTSFCIAISDKDLLNYCKKSELTGEYYLLKSKYKYSDIFQPDFWLPKNQKIKSFDDWVKLSFTYQAHGDEKFLHIGSQNTEGVCGIIRIDDVSIMKLSDRENYYDN